MNVNEEAREALWHEVNDLTDDELNWKPSADQWSIREILEHLHLMEEGIAKTIQHQLTAGESTCTSDKPIERAVDRSTKITAPDFATPDENFATLAELKEKLAGSHQVLLHIEESVPHEELVAKSYPHPVFGDMNLAQYIPFVGYHELRHIEQIKEVKQLVTSIN